jgi:competence protein ComFC
VNILKPIKSYASRAAALAMPYKCPGCGEVIEKFICLECEKKTAAIVEPYCKRCGRPLPPGVKETSDCRECRDADIPFDLCRSVFYYSPPVDELIKRFKFKRNYAAGRWLLDGACIRIQFQPGFFPGYESADGIVPVPLHPIKAIQRGFNQSEYFAHELGQRWNVAWMPCLARRRYTRPQSRLPLKEREKNVRGAFVVKKKAPVSGRKLILIDDVMTSGATVYECARVLKEAGAAEVYIATIARRVKNV